MPPLTAVYTAEQREAIAVAVVDRGMTSPAVVDAARAGRLTLNGRRLRSFGTSQSTVRDAGRRLRRRRAGELESALLATAPKDAVEELRRRLVNLADHELAELEKTKRGVRNLEHLRQVARVVREIAALPGPDDPRPPIPGQKIPGSQTNAGGATRGGLAAAVLAAARGREAPRQPTVEVEQDEPPPAETLVETRAAGEPEDPGAWARSQVAIIRTKGINSG